VDLADGPVVALTTSGWNVGEGLDMNRVLECDPITVTFWHDEASIRAFAYGQGSHRRQLDRHRAEGLADRTSFTRFRMLSSSGTWYGVDPAARIADTQD
jgi:hypothetical protein